MTLGEGTRLGPYEVGAPLGAGGMGEVYRARDTRLDRTVALKVLPERLSQESELRQRLMREARAISSLSHPHICALFDVGSEGGVDYLVMEYLEGETLAERLAKGPLPIELVLRYGVQVAEALDKAHRQGIVHRDLKPGNVMVTKSGVKLLDFGLAKIRQGGVESGRSRMATAALATPLTEKGAILGTFQYMSPEQLEGKETDHRSDLFALGAVLHEMATGQRAFSGESQASLIAAILAKDPPPISSLKELSPTGLDRLVLTCLAKDPDERWQSAGDVARELCWYASPQSAGSRAFVDVRRSTRPWMGTTAVFAGLSLILFLFQARRPAAPPPPVARLSILSPAETSRIRELALSPDGTKLALVATGTDGKDALWLRPLDSLEARRVPDTDDAANPFWSPDSRSLGFSAHGKVQRIEIAGGKPQVICEAPLMSGGSWGRDGTILIGNMPGSISRVPATGGTPSPVTKGGPERSQHWPSFLPDGEHFVFLDEHADGVKSAVSLGSLGSSETRILLAGAESNVLLAGGRLLTVESGSLMARAFDPRTLQVSGEPVLVADSLADNDFREFLFSASTSGSLAYRSTDPKSRLTWFDRLGKPIGTISEPGQYVHVELSATETTAAVERLEAGGRGLLLVDLTTQASSRFTFGKARAGSAVFSPDGSRIAYLSMERADFALHLRPVNGLGADEVLAHRELYPSSFTSDGNGILVESWTDATKADLGVLALDSAEHPIAPVVDSRAWENGGQISRDGRWLAYVSDESGRDEVYVQAFPKASAKWQASVSGAFNPRWRADGRELYFASPTGISAVDIDPTSARPGPPRLLFDVRVRQFQNRFGYAPTLDGKRFLVNVAPPEPPTTVVMNWAAGLAR